MTEVEKMVMEKVGEVIALIEAAKCLEEVICALHSLAALFFPVDSLSLLGLFNCV